MSEHESSAGSEAEEFHFLRWGFDIRALRGLLERTRTPPTQVDVPVQDVAGLLSSDPSSTPPEEMRYPLVGIDIDWGKVDRLPTRALQTPIFIAPLGEMGSIVIDGWHRIALARRRGVPSLPGLLLTRRQASHVLLPGSAKLPSDRAAR